MESLRCSVVQVRYRNPDNGYSVLSVKVPGKVPPQTMVGDMPTAEPGTELLCHGTWQEDPRHGRQFVVQTYEEALPVTPDGIRRYLGSGLIAGIGPRLAELIVKRWGADTLRVLDDDIGQLRKIRGIGEQKMERIRRAWERQRGIKTLMSFLQGHGISAAYATKIHKRYGHESVDTLRTNPYRLITDIPGFGFRTADDIALKMGIGAADSRRCQGALMHILTNIADAGHTYATPAQLDRAAAELNIPADSLTPALQQLAADKQLFIEQDAIYLRDYYFAERGVARRLLNLARAHTLTPINNIPATPGLQYDGIQLQAIRQACSSPVTVITGGPGTGKTTTTLGILAALTQAHDNVLLAAPTGRAAKRLSEATGLEASTIHRLLEYTPIDGFRRDEHNPLEADTLIVDECSMIDLRLMHALLRALNPGTRLILVGDIDQLPSVGAGNVLSDIIASAAVPVVRLTRIFRQAQSSRIVMNAHAINSGRMPDIATHTDSDFFFLHHDNPDTIAPLIADLVARRLPRAYNISPRDIQVLTPMRKGPAGTQALNDTLQQALNPDNVRLTHAARTLRRGDRVMQTRNNYDKEVFNGDLGYITDIDIPEATLTVTYDGQEVEYDTDDLDDLLLAYATTVHKAQGSEYPVVVMPLIKEHYIMLQRNLLYTAITRARRLCVIVGSTHALQTAVSNLRMQPRNSRLTARLSGQL